MVEPLNPLMLSYCLSRMDLMDTVSPASIVCAVIRAMDERAASSLKVDMAQPIQTLAKVVRGRTFICRFYAERAK